MLRGEVWLINLDPTIGSEIRKMRPAVIVSDDAIGILPLRIIVPLTDWKERYNSAAWMVKVEPAKTNGLSKLSAADAFQVRSVAEERFVRRMGMLDNSLMRPIEQALAAALSISIL